ncbi:hypothetical protein QBC38DRAFT_286350 [Podospora fimiseda]|uniref:NACHT-NTPase and P-loop NTPases N-terminal domain-containing protein n=1 Tax=Podospora fimiseda TaxID=252190 RepID=A0AAN7GQV6_9PEZI|nr:hypothetical protein QBC38DRAFT_286350 [Podospora fimiseda]
MRPCCKRIPYTATIPGQPRALPNFCLRNHLWPLSLRATFSPGTIDPLTAFAFAGTVITFVDFSWSLLIGTCDVYRSPTCMTQENARIGDIIHHLRDITADLEATPTGNSKHDKALRNLANDCSELATKLMDLLKKLKRNEKKNSIWSSLKVKWASLRKAGDVEDMVERLRDYRSEIILRLNLMLSVGSLWQPNSSRRPALSPVR